MQQEINLNGIKEELERKIGLSFTIRENKFFNEQLNHYIIDGERYENIEGLCEAICKYIENEYEVFTDYSILDSSYEFVIEVF